MRPIRSLIVFAAGATAATPRGRAAAKRAFGALAQGAREASELARGAAPGGLELRSATLQHLLSRQRVARRGAGRGSPMRALDSSTCA